MHISTALQDELLDEIIEGKTPSTIFLMNGFQIRGMILDHDDAVIVVDNEGKHQMVYKHAVSTVVPMRSFKNVNK